MKLQILSDTHNSKYQLSDDADLIIHAGDFSNHFAGAIEFAEYCQKLNKNFIFVLGNHDYYGAHYDFVINFLRENYPQNALLDDNHIKIADKIFVGGTLFTNFRSNAPLTTPDKLLQFKKDAEQSIYDFERIMIGASNRTITADDYILLFQRYYQNIMQFKDQENVIVISHFPPHLACLDPYWGHHPIASALNPYFINDLDITGFKLWIAGHTHTAIDTVIDGCRLIINPLGYPQEQGKNGFRENLIIHI
ncbi:MULTISPECIES: metallophosphoesterase [unclassified Acinetobacter]|uniref:metallophosphoesterase family protein n=1 Tax=unclassified Acinetobacter TaxID=196816 RepID=UPI002934D71B|nr:MULTISPECIES: metallophosphoesterase [unclassified Acinetobacter]WOE32917.1 metallophosphoesterase [Acinetobacter sp. SAAs470]WOE38394.1 metallophosphoesterase [Acinetobacter sp. SAAs474]